MKNWNIISNFLDIANFFTSSFIYFEKFTILIFTLIIQQYIVYTANKVLCFLSLLLKINEFLL